MQLLQQVRCPSRRSQFQDKVVVNASDAGFREKAVELRRWQWNWEEISRARSTDAGFKKKATDARIQVVQRACTFRSTING